MKTRKGITNPLFHLNSLPSAPVPRCHPKDQENQSERDISDQLYIYSVKMFIIK